MTERRGRVARWQTALLLTPGAAALFSGAVSWAASTTPVSTPAPALAPTPAARPDPAAAAQLAAYRHRLEAQVARSHEHARQLRRELAALRARTARLRAIATAPLPVGPVSLPGGGGAPVVVVAPPPVVAVAPPPPVHAATGASGHP